jgi:predicted P-loop ATPase
MSATHKPPTVTPGRNAIVSILDGEQHAPALMNAWGFIKGANGSFASNLGGVCGCFEQHPHWAGKIWYDTFLDRVLTTAWGEVQEWTDDLTTRATRWFQGELNLANLNSERVHEAVQSVARGQPRNALVTWLESLEWDGTPRLRDALSRGFGAAENEYTQAVSKCWFTSLAARALWPGCKVDTMPVFEGGQGIGKSSALAIIGGEWFGECHEDIGSKDFVLGLRGKLLVEIAEMHAFGKADVNKLKGIMSAQVDRIRPPYGRSTQDFPRGVVFAGTTNRDDWQADDTGARRFWPIWCGTIDREWLRDNRGQLFAEAVARFKAGEDWWSVPAAVAAEEADRRRPEDPWADVLREHMDTGRTYSTKTLLKDAFDIEAKDYSPRLATRLAALLKAQGWLQGNIRTATGKARLWKHQSLEQ